MRSYKEEYFFRMKKKPFMKFLKRWLAGTEYSEVHVAKCLSSMITHCLIEMEKTGTLVFKALDIPFQMDSLSKFVEGGLANDELKELYRERFGRFIK